MSDAIDINTVIVGAGQAGLSISYYLKQQHIPHIILEQADKVGSAWHTRWDNFCLVTPNWQCQLPGHPYQGDDPDGFMLKHEIIEYIESYAQRYELPIKTSTQVQNVNLDNTKFIVTTPSLKFRSENLVVATGGYHNPNIPSFAKNIPSSIKQIHSSEYRNPEQFKGENILLVGTGQSGCQIAEELHTAGNQMYISLGSAPRVNRRYKGKDIVRWLDDMGYYKLTADKNPHGKAAALRTNHCVSGKNGGMDINMRALAQEGAKLFGKISACGGSLCKFSDDLIQNLDAADEEANSVLSMVDDFIEAEQLRTPPDTNTYPDFVPITSPTLNLIDENITSVIWCTGYKPDYRWLDIPTLGQDQRPEHEYGISHIPGLYFLGLNWQRYWGSGRLYQVGLDAQYICEQLSQRIDKQA
ncbi:FAD-dependent oxidoreductase [Alteromonadaceae bacterium M269]|nr:FAD-dependent oxidoreductase [Alteromonadaceae bacterium M269]